MPKYRALSALLAFLFLASAAYAKDPPAQVLVWPDAGAPVLRFSFGRFKQIGSSGSQHSFVADTTAENLWSKSIGAANFSLYLFDKNHVRIGEGWISVSNVARGEIVKFQTSVTTSGSPVSLALAPRSLPAELQSFLPARKVSLTVNSVPQGVNLRVDGDDVGLTPKLVQLGLGKHMLEFSKEGFNKGRFPVEIGPDDTSGGSVSYELGTSAHDTIELRDGTVLTGDLESVSAVDVVIRAGGRDTVYPRNQVKKIMMVERDESPDVTQPSGASPHP